MSDEGIPKFHQIIWEFPESGTPATEKESGSWIHIAYMIGSNARKLTLATNNESLRKWNKNLTDTYSNMRTAGNLTADQSKVKDKNGIQIS